MPETPVLMIEVASIVAGFLEPHDVENLMRTCKQIRTDDSVKKICIDMLTEQYTRRLYPVHAGDYRILTRNGLDRPRVYRIYSQFGTFSAYLLLGAPEFDEINAGFFHIHHGNVFYTFFMSPEPFIEEDGRVSDVPVRSLVECDFMSTVIGISFRDVAVDNSMQIVLVIYRARSSTLTLRVASRFSEVDD
jgi:hypothetical protein